MSIAVIKTKAVETVKGAAAEAKVMSLGDWGSLASIFGVALWVWDQKRKKSK